MKITLTAISALHLLANTVATVQTSPATTHAIVNAGMMVKTVNISEYSILLINVTLLVA